MPTLLGFAAIVLWAALALLTSLTTRIPLFEWLALTFGLATLLSLPMLLRAGALASLRAVPMGAWALGIIGLFGYHALYMLALKNAPTAQAGLIAYLWPLLIVLLFLLWLVLILRTMAKPDGHSSVHKANRQLGQSLRQHEDHWQTPNVVGNQGARTFEDVREWNAPVQTSPCRHLRADISVQPSP